MNGKWFWIIVAGIIGGFAFAVGTSIEAKAEDKLRTGLSTANGGAVGTPTANNQGSVIL